MSSPIPTLKHVSWQRMHAASLSSLHVLFPDRVLPDEHQQDQHACRRLGEPREVLAKLLGGPVKLYVTRCSLLELKQLGSEFAGGVSLTCAILTAHCSFTVLFPAICSWHVVCPCTVFGNALQVTGKQACVD